MPLFFLGGVARYLFVPLGEAVVFAMLASYLLSRTLVPTLVMFLLHRNEDEGDSRKVFSRFQKAFERRFERLRAIYRDLLTQVVLHRRSFIPIFLVLCLCTFLIVPWLGQDFFPQSDSGQFILHMRSKTGMRIEETARLSDLVENSIRQEIPTAEMDNILDNVGLPYSPLNTMHSTSGVLGANDVDILVSLREKHHPTADYVRTLRQGLADEFPGVTFYFLPADIVTQILNFGLPSPIDVQIEGNNVELSHRIAEKMMPDMRSVAGLTDLHIQQPLDYPTLDVTVDRTKASQAGYTELQVAQSALNTLS